MAVTVPVRSGNAAGTGREGPPRSLTPHGADMLKDLRRPFTAEAAKFKVQANLSNGRGLIVAYLDARLVSERLNLVVGMDWKDAYRPYGDRIDSGLLWCDLTIGAVTRSDVGEGTGKAGVSDAFKRAAVRWGVGVPFYATPQQILPSSENGEGSGDKPYLRRVSKKGKDVLYITADCERWLRERYREWIDDTGAEHFGEPLSHGDVEGSVGDPIEAAGEPEESENLELAAKRAEAEALYAEVMEDVAKRRKMPKGKFSARLEACERVEQVEELIEELRAL